MPRAKYGLADIGSGGSGTGHRNLIRGGTRYPYQYGSDSLSFSGRTGHLFRWRRLATGRDDEAMTARHGLAVDPRYAPLLRLAGLEELL